MMIVLKSTTLIHKKAPAEAGAYKTTAYSLVVKRSFRDDLYATKVHNFFFHHIPPRCPLSIKQ